MLGRGFEKGPNRHITHFGGYPLSSGGLLVLGLGELDFATAGGLGAQGLAGACGI